MTAVKPEIKLDPPLRQLLRDPERSKETNMITVMVRLQLEKNPPVYYSVFSWRLFLPDRNVWLVQIPLDRILSLAAQDDVAAIGIGGQMSINV